MPIGGGSDRQATRIATHHRTRRCVDRSAAQVERQGPLTPHTFKTKNFRRSAAHTHNLWAESNGSPCQRSRRRQKRGRPNTIKTDCRATMPAAATPATKNPSSTGGCAFRQSDDGAIHCEISLNHFALIPADNATSVRVQGSTFKCAVSIFRHAGREMGGQFKTSNRGEAIWNALRSACTSACPCSRAQRGNSDQFICQLKRCIARF